MEAVHFPEANAMFGPPEGMTEHQIMPVAAHTRKVNGGSCDGSTQTIVAWKPNKTDLERLQKGGLIYLSTLGGLPPHFLSTCFSETSVA